MTAWKWVACAIASVWLAASPGLAGDTDIRGAPSQWRGTLLEGTDAIIATNTYGQPLFVKSGQTVGPIFAPAAISGERLASEFKKLCIDTGLDEVRLAAAVAAGSSGFELTNRKIMVAPERAGIAPFEASVWRSGEARLQIWTGDLSALKNRETLSRWRRGSTSMPFTTSRVLVPACNLTVMATGFHDPQSFLDAISASVGAAPKKAVTKAEWADGYWSTANADGSETRIVYSMVDFDKSEQLLHVGIARLAARK